MYSSLFFAILIVIVGTLVSFLTGYFLKVDLPPVCKDWNKNFVMEISLFFTGFISYALVDFGILKLK
jgi:hypothetical protein